VQDVMMSEGCCLAGFQVVIPTEPVSAGEWRDLLFVV
jgi:hypothetical protein